MWQWPGVRVRLLRADLSEKSFSLVTRRTEKKLFPRDAPHRDAEADARGALHVHMCMHMYMYMYMYVCTCACIKQLQLDFRRASVVLSSEIAFFQV